MESIPSIVAGQESRPTFESIEILAVLCRFRQQVGPRFADTVVGVALRTGSDAKSVEFLCIVVA